MAEPNADSVRVESLYWALRHHVDWTTFSKALLVQGVMDALHECGLDVVQIDGSEASDG